MRKTQLFVCAAALILASGFGMWAAATTQARVAVAKVQSPSILELTMRAGDLPTAKDVDYSFVF